MNLEREKQEWLNSNEGGIFCGEPWKYRWSKEDIIEFSKVMKELFNIQESEDSGGI